jgi:hypothetical protein
MTLELARHKTHWRICKYLNDVHFAQDKPFDVVEWDGNCLLTEGIALLQSLLTGGAGTAYAQASTYLGVGDSATAADPAQTGLLAVTNKAYVACEAAYPTIVGSKTTWRGIFTSLVANYAWNEFTISNANSNSGVNLNRAVIAQGTKTSGQTWTLDVEITWS